MLRDCYQLSFLLDRISEFIYYFFFNFFKNFINRKVTPKKAVVRSQQKKKESPVKGKQEKTPVTKATRSRKRKSSTPLSSEGSDSRYILQLVLSGC